MTRTNKQSGTKSLKRKGELETNPFYLCVEIPSSLHPTVWFYLVWFYEPTKTTRCATLLIYLLTIYLVLLLRSMYFSIISWYVKLQKGLYYYQLFVLLFPLPHNVCKFGPTITKQRPTLAPSRVRNSDIALCATERGKFLVCTELCMCSPHIKPIPRRAD